MCACVLACARLDDYIDKALLSPDCVLTTEEIEDMCAELKEASLLHPLLELRARYLNKYQAHNAEYALLPATEEELTSYQSSYSSSH